MAVCKLILAESSKSCFRYKIIKLSFRTNAKYISIIDLDVFPVRMSEISKFQSFNMNFFFFFKENVVNRI